MCVALLKILFYILFSMNNLDVWEIMHIFAVPNWPTGQYTYISIQKDIHMYVYIESVILTDILLLDVEDLIKTIDYLIKTNMFET